jgi:general secretion pathway protein M
MNRWLELLEARWQAWWPELEVREQRLVIGAGALLVLAIVWWVALAPALRTLSSSAAEHARLDAQLQQMTQLQAQAKPRPCAPCRARPPSTRGSTPSCSR